MTTSFLSIIRSWYCSCVCGEHVSIILKTTNSFLSIMVLQLCLRRTRFPLDQWYQWYSTLFQYIQYIHGTMVINDIQWINGIQRCFNTLFDLCHDSGALLSCHSPFCILSHFILAKRELRGLAPWPPQIGAPMKKKTKKVGAGPKRKRKDDSGS